MFFVCGPILASSTFLRVRFQPQAPFVPNLPGICGKNWLKMNGRSWIWPRARTTGSTAAIGDPAVSQGDSLLLGGRGGYGHLHLSLGPILASSSICALFTGHLWQKLSKLHWRS
jgi:hypothetical protein